MLTSGAAEGAMRSSHGTIRGWLDRTLTLGSRAISRSARFRHYQRLQAEVRELVEAAAPAPAGRRDVRVLELACGPGHLTCELAEAGFSVTGLDAYAGLVEEAKEQRRARHLSNVTFRRGDLAAGTTFRDETFDQVVSIHALYVHPAPDRLLREAHRVLKPGGQAVFVSHTRRIGWWSTLRELARRDGLRAALHAILWVLPGSIFESARRRIRPCHWDEDTFTGELRRAGFSVQEIRRTFRRGASLLVRARKGAEA
jgi:ubiquinone/menaquinone biosynthesis C-methylase UbiE